MMKYIHDELEKIYKTIKSKINDNKYFLSERDIQAYIYSRLKWKFKEKYSINLDPTITNKQKKKYKRGAKNIPPFDLPDIIINKRNNLKFSKKERRIEPKFKGKCFAIEIKFIKPFIKNYSLNIKSDLEKLKWYKNSRLIVIDCGRTNRTRTYKKYESNRKFVLIKPTNYRASLSSYYIVSLRSD